MTGKQLKAWRLSRGYSRTEIASHCGVSSARTVEKWEQNPTKQIPGYAIKLIELLRHGGKMHVDLTPNARAELEKRSNASGRSVQDELATLIKGIFGGFVVAATLGLVSPATNASLPTANIPIIHEGN